MVSDHRRSFASAMTGAQPKQLQTSQDRILFAKMYTAFISDDLHQTQLQVLGYIAVVISSQSYEKQKIHIQRIPTMISSLGQQVNIFNY